ncbi:MAG: FkbM family methyltransferase [Deltaproteobacteria bacterium]|nr:FkbM family methyltransferase [Deltaproteobacteria bacterium]
MTDFRTTLFRLGASACYQYSRIPRARGAWRFKQLVMRLAPKQPSHFEVKREGMRFDLELDEGNDLDWSLLFWGHFEPTSSDWVRRTVREGWTCVDVGANVGYFTVMLGQLAGRQGRVIAFEPCAPFRQRLERNVRLNGLTNVQSEDLGLSDRAAVTTIHLTACTASIDPAHWSPSAVKQSIEIRLGDLDTWWREHGTGRLDFIKVDTDGHEAKFLAGARETIARYKPVMMVEVVPEVLHGGDAAALALLTDIAAMGYTLCSEDGQRRFAGPREALAGLLAGGLAGANAVCVPT